MKIKYFFLVFVCFICFSCKGKQITSNNTINVKEDSKQLVDINEKNSILPLRVFKTF